MRVLKMLDKLTVVDSKPSRERLKAAIAARDAARQDISNAQSTLERLQAVIRESDVAARAAADAARKETEARNAWVRSGCTFSAARELQSLTDEAAQASHAAESAARNAEAVSKQLARAEDAVRSNEVEVGHRETEISAAIGVILAEEAAPLLKHFERLAEEYRVLRAKVMGVSLVLGRPWTLDRNKMNPSWEGEKAITDALQRAAIKDWDAERDAARARDFVEGTRGCDEAMLEQLTSHWRARAAQLRENPDA